MPRGGARLGSGRKPLSAVERVLTGKVLWGPGAGDGPVVAPVQPVDPPDDLPSAVRAVWERLAPHAVTARTLTPGTAVAFALLCRNVVLEAALAGDPATQGGVNHRGLINRVDAELAAFSLRPFGKPILAAAEAPATPLDRFLRR